jgi:OOP family OmpA-OmpF porin
MTVVGDFMVVPRAPDVAAYPAVPEHVWIPPPSGRIFVVARVSNFPKPRPPVLPVVTSPAAASEPRSRLVFSAVVHFAFDKSNLDEASRASLDRLVAQAGDSLSQADVEIDGFTDSIGTDPYNMKLSQRRADAVRGYLVKRGAQRPLIVLRPNGDADPVDTNKTAAGRASNRRATTEVHPQ